jgi:hypothetical protein
MSDLIKGKALLFAMIRAIEEQAVENEALWHLLRESWPDYYQKKNYQMLEPAVELVKADERVTARLRQSFHEFRERLEVDIDLAQALELFVQFRPTGKPH